MTDYRADIQSGPSKFDLMLALFNRKSINQQSVLFTAGPNHELHEIVINGVEIEDGSGESWLIKGYLRHRGPPRRGVPDAPSLVEGYYRTDKRTGWLKVQL